MEWKRPKDSKEFLWTSHVMGKMRQHRLSEQKVRGVIFRPKRKEEGIAPRTVAVMQGAGSKKNPYEIWVMYQVAKISAEGGIRTGGKNEKFPPKADPPPAEKMKNLLPEKKKIISAWRYPGISPKRNPIPLEILNELADIE